MPELPEVETVCRGLTQHLPGRRVLAVKVRRRDLRIAVPKDFERGFTGATLARISRRAKYILFHFDNNNVLLAHLGMSGSFTVVPATGYQPRIHDHVLLHLGNGNAVVYHDPRRFGMMDVLRKTKEKTHKLLKDMGPEPLLKEFSVDYLKKALEGRNAPIKPVLMDQKIVVGVGNIYASESLFLAGIHPTTPACDVAGQSASIISSIQKTLRNAITSGGSTLRNYVGADGASGYFQHHFNVYNRQYLPCFACGEAIVHVVQAGRATYFCPQCQKQSSGQRTRSKKITQKKQ